MSYLKLSTMEYPRFEGDIRLEHPEITEDQTGDTFPDVEDYVKVQDVLPPKIDPKTQYTKLGQPELIDGAWHQTWEVKEYTEEQLAKRKAMQDERLAKMNRPSPNVNGTPPDVIE